MDKFNKEKLCRAGSATVANILLQYGLKNVIMHGVQALSTEQAVMIGEAYTLRFIPAREDLDSMANYAQNDNKHRRAIEECPPQSVLVIDAFSCTHASSMGDMMATRLKYRGVAGVVTDGGFRDSQAIKSLNFPCFQKQNASPATPIALHPIALNEPIGCGGVAVYPGDIILGDANAVVVIPSYLVNEVAEKAAFQADYEEFVAEKLKEGRTIFGLFPADSNSLEEYQSWKIQQNSKKDKS